MRPHCTCLLYTSIQDICATCNCKIDVQEDGHVFVSAVDQEDAKRAIFTIKTIVEDPEILSLIHI